MENDQSSNKSPDKEENKNVTSTPAPPMEASKKSPSVNDLSDTKGKNSRGTDGKKSKASKTKKPDKPNLSSKKSNGGTGPEIKKQDSKIIPETSGDKVITKDTDVKESPEKKRQRFKCLLLSWEVNLSPVEMAGCLTNDNKITDCSYVALSHPTKDSEWTSSVEQSSIIIIYSSASSERPIYKMGRYLDYCIRRKGPEKVIVVIGDADTIAKEWEAKWEQEQFSRTLEQFRIPKAELHCITRKDTVQSMLGKIEEMRKSLTCHTDQQEKPTGSGLSDSEKEVKQMSQKNKNKKNPKKKNNNKMSQSQKEHTSIEETQQEPQEKEKSDEMKQVVRIVSWTPDRDSDWLRTLLQAPYFKDTVKDVETINVTTSELERLKEQTSSATTFILYFSSDSLDSFCAQMKNVNLLSNFQNKTIIVVIDNLDNKSAERKSIDLYDKSPLHDLSGHRFLFKKEEKELDYLTHLIMDTMTTQEAAERWRKFQDMINRRIVLPDEPQKLGTVGIFSRSSNSDYDWLEKLLKSPKLQDSVDDVRPFIISNRRYEEFYNEVNNCNFGILYHTKNRGRVNITNVTDSLYDMEIEYLSSVLGLYKVLVIIDDLQDSSNKQKKLILQSQPDIPKYARNLILVTQEEKSDEAKILKKLMDAIMSPALETSEGTYKNGDEEEDDTIHVEGNKDTTNVDAKKVENNSAKKEKEAESDTVTYAETATEEQKKDSVEQRNAKDLPIDEKSKDSDEGKGTENATDENREDRSSERNEADHSKGENENSEGKTREGITENSDREQSTKKADPVTKTKNVEKENNGKKTDKQSESENLQKTEKKNEEETFGKPEMEQKATATLSEQF